MSQICVNINVEVYLQCIMQVSLIQVQTKDKDKAYKTNIIEIYIMTDDLRII